jgi:hypothetical protein
MFKAVPHVRRCIHNTASSLSCAHLPKARTGQATSHPSNAHERGLKIISRPTSTRRTIHVYFSLQAIALVKRQPSALSRVLTIACTLIPIQRAMWIGTAHSLRLNHPQSPVSHDPRTKLRSGRKCRGGQAWVHLTLRPRLILNEPR